MEQIALRRERSARLLHGGTRFFLAGALTATQTVGGYAPFALGCVAAAGPGLGGLAALLGSSLGALLFMDFAHMLSFCATAVLIFTAAMAFKGLPALEKPAVMPVLAAVMVLSVGGIYILQSLSPQDLVVPCVIAATLAGVSAWFLQALLGRTEGVSAADGILFLCAILLLAVGEVTIWQLSLGRALLCTLLLYAAYDREPVTGAAAGLGVGLVTDLVLNSGSLYTAAYGIGSLLAALRPRRTTSALAFLCGILTVTLPSQQEAAQMLMLESLTGVILFLLLPARAFGGKRVRRPQVLESAQSSRLKAQLNKAAAALRDLYDSMGREQPQPTEENPATVFDRAAERVCRECALCQLCWQKEYTSTFNALNDATPFLLERGRVMAKDFPPYFADRCIHLTDFMRTIDSELSAFLLRRQYRRQLEETRRSAKGQYAQLSDLLTAAAAAFGESHMSSDEELHVQIGAALKPRNGEVVCGDTMESFRTQEGAWCLLLADGMGSGEEARRESALTCRLLRQFLEADIAPEAALKTLNSAMALRGAETGSFTTVDLCVCRGENGETTFYKFGAAPSYLKKGGTVRRVTGVSFPVGLRGAPAVPDITQAALEEGSFIVMISDGVADPNRDDWLQNLLAGWEGDDAQTLANLILSESVKREKLQDDCAVQVLYRPVGPIKKV